VSAAGSLFKKIWGGTVFAGFPQAVKLRGEDSQPASKIGRRRPSCKIYGPNGPGQVVFDKIAHCDSRAAPPKAPSTGKIIWNSFGEKKKNAEKISLPGPPKKQLFQKFGWSPEFLGKKRCLRSEEIR